MVKQASIFLLSIALFVMQFSIYAQNIESSLYTCEELKVTDSDTISCQNSNHFLLDENQHLRHNQDDVFLDRFGNRHHKNINTTSNGYQRMIPLTADYISPEGLFAIYLEDQITDNTISDFNNDANYRNVVAQIFADLEQLIIENPTSGVLEPVKIELQSIYTNSSALASASSYYDYNGVPVGTIVEGDVWKAINSGSNNPDEWDGLIRVNFFHSWYSNFSNPTGIYGTNSFDMYAVLLHEIMHALGFASGIDENGNPKNGNAYLKYDNLLHTNSGVDLIVPSGASWIFNSVLNSSTITSGCPNTSSVRLGDNDLFVHAPQMYSSGSTLSHIDTNNDCNYPIDDYIMAYAVSVETPRRPNTDEFDILCSLNYNLSTQYGNNAIIEFGNPATITTQNNIVNNIIPYGSCEPLVFGINDFVNLGTQPTIDNCQGSVLSILEQDLLSNDTSSLGLQLEVSNLSLNGNLITTFTGVAPNRTFLVTPNTVGNLQLIYKPIDTNGNLGNDTYANIIVTICSSLNCTNTSSCNLICNSEFLDPTPGIIPSFNAFNMAYHMNTNGNGPSELDGWFAFNGSPTFYDFTIPCTGSQCPNLNYFKLPGSIGEGAVALVGCGSNQPNNGEGLLTNVTISNNVNYLLSINRNRWMSNQACSYQVYLSDETAINVGDFYGSCGGTVGVLDGLPLQTIAFEDNITSNQWQQSLFCFTANDDYQSLILNAYSASVLNSLVLIDNVELIEDKFITNTANIQTTYNLICGQDANLGKDLCLVTSLEYQYWDVTDVSNAFQLTNALVTPNYYVSGLNSSEVILNDIMASVDIELRRVFVNANSVPINVNTCDTVLPITIQVLPEIPQDASFTSLLDATNCLAYTFQANETYETHEWDFNNDGIIDISGSGSNVANTNPSYIFPGIGTYTVNHTVSNECGSLTYQEDIVISCPTICSSSTTWNGSSWSNGLPSLSKEAIINGHYNTANYNSFTACSLTVNNPYILQIDALNYVEVNYNTTILGNLIVKHTGSFVQIEDYGFFQLQGNGTALVEKETATSISNTEVTYLGLPISNTTVGTLFSNNPFINNYRYTLNTSNFQDSCYETFNDNTCVPGLGLIYDGIDDNGDDWVFATANLLMQPGKGIVVRASMNASTLLNFNGSFNTGITYAPITRNDAEIGDSNPIFIGNPYASAIDVDAFLERNMTNHPLGTNTNGIIDGVIYIWSHNTPAIGTANGNQNLNYDSSDYAIINLTGEIEGGDQISPNRFIPSVQGFFVNYSDEALSSNGTIVFNNSMRVTQHNDQFFRTSETIENKIWLDLSSETGVHGEILLGYVEGATSDLDKLAYDAFEHTPLGQNTLVYFNIPESNKKYVIQGKASNDLNIDEVISIGFFNSIQETTTFTLKIDDFQGEFFNTETVYLKDNLLNTCHNLSAMSYSFNSEIGDYKNRFELVFNNCDALNVSEYGIEHFIVYPNPTKHTLYVKSKNSISSLTLYNNLGQLILQNSDLDYLNVSNISEGLYFLKIKDISGNIKNVRIIKK